MSAVNPNYRSSSFFSPQVLSYVSRMVKMMSYMLYGTRYLGGTGFNMGPGTDMMTPNYNPFSGLNGSSGPGSYPPPSSGSYGGSSGASGGSGSAGGGSGSIGGDSGSTGSGSGSAGGSSGPSTSSSTGNSGNASYANNMLNILKNMNAPQSLIDAYRQQYVLLGFLPSDGSSGGSTGGSSGGSTGGSSGGSTGGSSGGSTGGSSGGSTGGSSGGSTGGSSGGSTGGNTGPGTGGGAIGSNGDNDTPGTPGAAGQVKPGNQHAYDHMIAAAAKKYGVDPLLIKAIMRQESDFDPGATSASGCEGLVQVSPGTQPDTGVSGNLYQPSVCIDAGTAYIKKMLDATHGDVHKALLAYNAGPGAATDNAVPAGQDSSAGQYATTVEGWYNDLKTKGEVNTALGSKPGS